MARARLIAACLSTSRRFHQLQTVAGPLAEFAQLLFPLLVIHADDFGRMEADPLSVKLRVHPGSPRSDAEFLTAMTHLERVGLIATGEFEFGSFLQILDFDRYQQGLHRRTTSKFPELPGTSRNFPECPAEEKRTDLELKRTEEKRTEQIKPPRAKPARLAVDENFNAFYDYYPKHVGRASAARAWAKINPDGLILEKIAAALRWQINQPQWLKDNGQFVPHPATWLNQHRWEDEPFDLPSNGQPEPHVVDWFDECQRIHDGACGSQRLHQHRLDMDRGPSA